jgi:hypothetical protein
VNGYRYFGSVDCHRYAFRFFAAFLLRTSADFAAAFYDLPGVNGGAFPPRSFSATWCATITGVTPPRTMPPSAWKHSAKTITHILETSTCFVARYPEALKPAPAT